MFCSSYNILIIICSVDFSVFISTHQNYILASCLLLTLPPSLVVLLIVTQDFISETMLFKFQLFLNYRFLSLKKNFRNKKIYFSIFLVGRSHFGYVSWSRRIFVQERNKNAYLEHTLEFFIETQTNNFRIFSDLIEYLCFMLVYQK